MHILKLISLSIVVLALGSPSSAQGRTLDSGSVWYGPALGSHDMLSLFTDSAQWDSARSQIDVFQLLTHHVNSWPCFGDLCNDNTLENLIEVDAFNKLDQWGIEIAIEGAGILPQTPFGTPTDCEVEKQTAVQNAFNWTVDAIANVQANGGQVHYVAVDEPIRRWYSNIYPPTEGPECKTESLAEIAEMVADFITMMNNAAPWIGVGQIILYPELDVDGIKEYVTELENLGIALPFVHLDVHGLRIIEYAGPVYGRVTLDQVRADLLELETYLHARNITFAPILIDLRFNTQLWEYGEYSDEVYYTGALDWINEVNISIGQPYRCVFESWARPQYSDTSLLTVIHPTNLPESDSAVFSHTRLISEALTVFNPPPQSCCDLPGDYNNDGGYAIGDVTSVVARIFSGGPPPACFDEGDFNGDGLINIQDVTDGIARIFLGGPAPVCGTTGS